jgi:predicted CoA-substrate-specific enzyme activase
VVLSGGETRRWQNNDEDWVHDVGALVERAAHLDRKINAVLHVGASGVALITLDEKGDLRAYETNTLCAAGTGSFLDEQAARLGIDYAQTAVPDPEGEIPVIATRCSVFAKSDLVHRQQEGFSRPALWAGLCEGMTSTLFQTLLKGRHLPDNTLITGGVSRNTFVIEAARRRHPGQIVATEDGHLAVAIGAAWLARKTQPLLTVEHLKAQLENGEVQAASNSDRHPALKLLKSSYPSFDVHREWQDDADNEIRLNRSLLAGPIPVWMGVDIGSTSTKLAALDENSDVICDIYRRTAGEPLVATRLVLQAFHQLGLEAGVVWEVRGLATTGSGRKLAGMAFGADAIINEITAHARGAIATAGNDIETIFEIGGQDAKYIRIHNGLIRDSNMNFVCSAGTGSFVEEQARKLGFPVQTVGSVTEGVAPPVTSDRCTVFMEQDVVKLLAAGHTRADAMGGVLYSVVKNYLNKVVGNRQVSSRRVVFQGATARNRGLVAAFENLLGVEVVVSPYCHVMGCIGAALVSQERVVAESRFLGFSKLDRKIEIQHSRCELCSNVCKITHAQVAGSDEETSWGYLCGREPGESARAMTHDRAFRVVSRMERQAVAACNKQARPDRPVAGLPLSLSGRALLPFWAAICRELGIPLQPGTETTEHVKQQGAALAAADFCFPVKAHLGHLKTLLEHPEVDCLLVPFYISEEMNKHTSNSLVCPYVESSPSLFRAVVPEQDGRKVLSPILDFRWSLKRQAKALLKELLPVYSDLKEGAVRKALAVAHKTRAEFSTKLVQEGEKILAEAQADGRAVLVFVGRPYNVRDLGLNLALPRHFAQHGYDVLPHEMLPFKPEILGIEFQNIYWSYGQRILSALRQVGAQDNLFAVYLSNFNCGPDSFLLTYAEEILQDKPFLVLELDEHSSEGGYLTRIEAFLDVIDNVGKASSERNIRVLHPANKEFRGRTIWFPPLHPIVVRMFAAAFRKYGFDGQALPSETVTSFERGRSAVRGSECLPTCSTIGAFLDLMAERQLDPDKQAFFMATAPGPCRFGQYELLHRMVLDKAGYPNVPIMSPSSFNS